MRRVAQLTIALISAVGLATAAAQPAPPADAPARLSACFAPPEPCGLRIAQAILAARRSVWMQAYGFDYEPIVAALIADRRRGLDVQLILDRSNERRRGSALSDVLAAGIRVFIDDRPAIAHNKLVIIDGCTVVGGSFNYTRAAEYRNAENVTFLAGCEAAAPFIANWLHRRDLSRAPAAPQVQAIGPP